MYHIVTKSTKRIRELVTEIRTNYSYKTTFIKSVKKLNYQYKQKILKYLEYEKQMKLLLKDRTQQDWISYYDSYLFSLIKELENECNKAFYNAYNEKKHEDMQLPKKLVHIKKVYKEDIKKEVTTAIEDVREKVADEAAKAIEEFSEQEIVEEEKEVLAKEKKGLFKKFFFERKVKDQGERRISEIDKRVSELIKSSEKELRKGTPKVISVTKALGEKEVGVGEYKDESSEFLKVEEKIQEKLLEEEILPTSKISAHDRFMQSQIEADIKKIKTEKTLSFIRRTALDISEFRQIAILRLQFFFMLLLRTINRWSRKFAIVVLTIIRAVILFVLKIPVYVIYYPFVFPFKKLSRAISSNLKKQPIHHKKVIKFKPLPKIQIKKLSAFSRWITRMRIALIHKFKPKKPRIKIKKLKESQAPGLRLLVSIKNKLRLLLFDAKYFFISKYIFIKIEFLKLKQKVPNVRVELPKLQMTKLSLAGMKKVKIKEQNRLLKETKGFEKRQKNFFFKFIDKIKATFLMPKAPAPKKEEPPKKSIIIIVSNRIDRWISSLISKLNPEPTKSKMPIAPEKKTASGLPPPPLAKKDEESLITLFLKFVQVKLAQMKNAATPMLEKPKEVKEKDWVEISDEDQTDKEIKSSELNLAAALTQRKKAASEQEVMPWLEAEAKEGNKGFLGRLTDKIKSSLKVRDSVLEEAERIKRGTEEEDMSFDDEGIGFRGIFDLHFFKNIYKKLAGTAILSRKTVIAPTIISLKKTAKETILMGDEEEFSPTLLTQEAKRIKSIIRRREKFSIYKPSSIGSLANLTVRRISLYFITHMPNFFKNLYIALRAANIKILSNTYVNIIFLGFFISFFVFSGLFGLGFLIVGYSFFRAVYKALFVGLLAGGISFFTLYMFPFIKIKQRRKSINTNLTFSINHMSAVAGSGVTPVAMFRLIAESKEYEEISTEIEKIVEFVDLFGYDLLTAIRTVASTGPSPALKEFFDGLVATIETGGDLKNYLNQKSEEAMLTYKLERQTYLEAITTYSDVYTGILVASPLFFVVALTLVNMLGGAIGGIDINVIIVIGTYMVIPMLNILFLIFLELTQPEV